MLINPNIYKVKNDNHIEMKTVKVNQVTPHTQGIKVGKTWYNFDKQNSRFSEDDMERFLDSNVKKGDFIGLNLSNGTNYISVSLNPKSGNSKSRSKNYNKSGPSKRTKGIVTQTAFKGVVKLTQTLVEEDVLEPERSGGVMSLVLKKTKKTAEGLLKISENIGRKSYRKSYEKRSSKSETSEEVTEADVGVETNPEDISDEEKKKLQEEYE